MLLEAWAGMWGDDSSQLVILEAGVAGVFLCLEV